MTENQTVELLKRRRSCRSFQDRQISQEELDEILACGLNAPSAMNRQDTKIVVVQSPELIRELSRLNGAVMNSEADPFYAAPTVCLILAPKDSRNGLKDGALVIGAMQSGAYALGIGSCWINRCEEMLQMEEGAAYLRAWGLEEYMGVGCCILGYPAQEPGTKTIQEDRVLRV